MAYYIGCLILTALGCAISLVFYYHFDDVLPRGIKIFYLILLPFIGFCMGCQVAMILLYMLI